MKHSCDESCSGCPACYRNTGDTVCDAICEHAKGEQPNGFYHPERQAVPQNATEVEQPNGTALQAVLIGGNHLASTLIAAIGGRLPDTREWSYEEIIRQYGIRTADEWAAWKAIMDLRDSLEAEPNGTAESPRHKLLEVARFLRACRGTEPAELFEEHAQTCEAAAFSGVSAALPEEHQHCVSQKTHAFAVRYAEQKGKEVEALTESIQQLRSYVRHAPHCYIATDDNGEYVNCYRPLGGCDCGLDDVLKAIGGK